MNISQHCIVPFTGYVRGYYNSQQVLTSPEISTLKTTSIMPTFGINTIQFFSLFTNESSATFKFFEPYSSTRQNDGYFYNYSNSTLYSVQTLLENSTFVRVILFFLPYIPEVSNISLRIFNQLTDN